MAKIKKKGPSRDFPLAPTFEETPKMGSDSTYRQKLKARKQAFNLNAAENGTLNQVRTDKIKNAIGVVGSAAKIITGLKNPIGQIKKQEDYR